MKRSFGSFNLIDLANKCDQINDKDMIDPIITPFASRVSSNDDLSAMTQPLKLLKISDIELNNIPYYSNGETLSDAFSRSLIICNMESSNIGSNETRRFVSCKQKPLKQSIPDNRYDVSLCASPDKLREGHFAIISSES
jgi:hypothetical protein